MVEQGIEPGTSLLVVRDPAHYTTRLVYASIVLCNVSYNLYDRHYRISLTAIIIK